jgi:hypothetical protein
MLPLSPGASVSAARPCVVSAAILQETEAGFGDGAIVSIGATVHPAAPVRVIPVTSHPVTVAVAVGSVVQRPPETVTIGALV